jgi:hypothetical protein
MTLQKITRQVRGNWTGSRPYRRANDMWQVKHLNGLMLVSKGQSRQGWRVPLTGENMSLEVFIASELRAAIGTEDRHDGARYRESKVSELDNT